jgi:hypothetical protein
VVQLLRDTYRKKSGTDTTPGLVTSYNAMVLMSVSWRWLYSGLLRRVLWQKFTDVSKVHAAFIILLDRQS